PENPYLVPLTPSSYSNTYILPSTPLPSTPSTPQFPPSRPVTPQLTGSTLFDELRQVTSRTSPSTSSGDMKDYSSSSVQPFRLTSSEFQSNDPPTPQSSPPISPSLLPPLPPSTPSTPNFSSTLMTHPSSQNSSFVEDVPSPAPIKSILKLRASTPSIALTPQTISSETLPLAQKSSIPKSPAKKSIPPPLSLSSTATRPPPLPLPPTWPTLKKTKRQEFKKGEPSDKLSPHHRQQRVRSKSISEGNDYDGNESEIIFRKGGKPIHHSKARSEDGDCRENELDEPLNDDFKNKLEYLGESFYVLSPGENIDTARERNISSAALSINTKIGNECEVTDQTKAIKNKEYDDINIYNSN
ncbi:17502_t:CDS:1, partial [Acaulospora colombiana]